MREAQQRRRRPHRLQPQGRPRARRGHQVPRLQRPQAPGGRRPGGDLFRAHRMRRRRAGRALPAADAGRAALARHHAGSTASCRCRNMKYDAIVGSGIEIVERVPIPDELIPPDASVEMEAKKAAGYYAPDGAPTRDDLQRHGRPAARTLLITGAPHRATCPTTADARARSLLSRRAPCASGAHRAARRSASTASCRISRVDSGRLDALRRLRARHDPRATIRRSTCRSMRAGGISRPAASTAGRRWTAAPPGRRTPRKARAAFDLAIVSVLLDAGAGAGLALPRGGERRDVRPLGRAGGGELRHVRGRRVLGATRPTAARRCRRRCAALTPRRLGARLPGRAGQSAGRARRPRGAAAPARRRRSPRNPDVFGRARRRRGPAGCSTISRRRPKAACCRAEAILRGAAASISGRSGRRASRSAASTSATPGGIRRSSTRRRDERPGAVPQAVAMAGLFADRAAAGAGIGVTGIDGLTGLAEYRNGGLFVDAGVLALQRSRRGRASPQPVDSDARRRMARADGGAARRRRRRWCATRSGWTPRQLPARQGAGRRHLGGRPAHRARRNASDGAPPLTVISDGRCSDAPAASIAGTDRIVEACPCEGVTVVDPTRWCSTS